MDEDDQMAAEAHQQELEERAIQEGRELLNQYRADCADFDRQTKAFHERMRKLCKAW